MKAIYLRKNFFERAQKFEDRVNAYLEFAEKKLKWELQDTCVSDKYVVLYFDPQEEQVEEEKQPVITGFKK